MIQSEKNLKLLHDFPNFAFLFAFDTLARDLPLRDSIHGEVNSGKASTAEAV
jgi:hypothetical protein